MLDPKGRQAAIEAANEMAIDGAPVPDYVDAIIRAYIDAIMPVRVSGLVERLRQYEGRSWETTYCYNGVRDEAGTSIENLSIGLATVWRGKLEAEDALASERAAHAETKRERDDLKDEWQAEFESRVEANTALRMTKARLDEAMKALEPFAEIAGEPWADENGWTNAACQNDRICDWFGPSAFRTARRALGGRSDG